MDKINLANFFGDIKFIKMPLKSACCMVPWYFLTFVFSAGASVIVGFATEWDLGARDDAKRKFYEYYSFAAILVWLSLVCFYVIARIVLFTCAAEPENSSSSSANSSSVADSSSFAEKGFPSSDNSDNSFPTSDSSAPSSGNNSSSPDDNICFAITIFLLIYGSLFSVPCVLFGLVMDEVIKIPTFILTILGAVFEGLLVLKACCGSCCCSEKDKGCCIPGMKLLANLIDLAMFILWTIKLATSSLSLPFIVVGVLKVVASVLSLFADIGSAMKDNGCNVSLVLVSLCSATGAISQSVLIPLRADGYITIHYVWCTMVLAMGFTLFALVVLVSGCCGYTLLMKDDNEDDVVQRVETNDGEDGGIQQLS